MALPACIELIFRLFFTLIKFAIENWFWLLAIMVGSFFFSKQPMLFSIVISVLDFTMDALSSVELLSGGIFAFFGGILISGFLASIIGLLYGFMVLMSQANIALKIIAFPFFVLLGAVIAVIPYASIPFNFLFNYLLSNERTANITCLVPIALFIVLAFFTEYVCSLGNYVLKAII